MILDCIIKAILIFVVYNGIVLHLFGIPKSLSMTFYLLKDSGRHGGWFPVMMYTMVTFLMPCWLTISEGSDFQFLSFLACAGILFVGTAPAFKSSSLENMVHQVSAYLAAAFSILWIVLVTPYWWIILIAIGIVGFLAVVTKTLKSGLIYWLEMIAFISTFSAVLMYAL